MFEYDDDDDDDDAEDLNVVPEVSYEKVLDELDQVNRNDEKPEYLEAALVTGHDESTTWTSGIVQWKRERSKEIQEDP